MAMILNQADNIYIGSTGVDKIYLGTEQVWPSSSGSPTHDYSQDYLTIEATSSPNATIKFVGGKGTLGYSTDGTNWTTGITSGETVLAQGEKIMFKNTQSGTTITCSGNSRCIVYGNPLSMCYGDNFTGHTEAPRGAFSGLFEENYGLVSAENLIIPSIVGEFACNGMFDQCWYLTTPPRTLPATTLALGCYQNMFRDCFALTTAPVMSATTIAQSCCAGMFEGCSSLTTAPALMATSADELGCYAHMFSGCTSLNYVKCLAAMVDGLNTQNWLSGVASTGTFVAATGSNWTTGGNGIPSGWTVQYV